MTPAAVLVHDLLAALDEVHGLRPATLATAGSWDWNAMAVDITADDTPSAGVAGGQQVVVRLVATRLPLPPVVRQAEQALLAVLAASDLPVTRLRLEITDLDGAAFGDTGPR